MSLLEHLDELRSRVGRSLLAYAVAFGACWFVSEQVLSFLLRPIRQHLYEGGEITFIYLTEPFMVRVKAAALVAVFLSAPYVLYELWSFVAPGLRRHERRLAIPFLLAGSLSFFVGGAFGYYAALPRTAQWLLELGGDFRAAITLSSAFTFESRIILAMGAVFEMPILIFFLARLGVVGPAFLLRHFRVAVVVIAIVAAVVTPTGDVVTMSLFAVPMVLLYLIGIGLAWIAAPRTVESTRS